MPASAVIPAPIAYTKVVAVKELSWILEYFLKRPVRSSRVCTDAGALTIFPVFTSVIQLMEES